MLVRGDIPPLPHTYSWRHAWISTGATLPVVPSVEIIGVKLEFQVTLPQKQNEL